MILFFVNLKIVYYRHQHISAKMSYAPRSEHLEHLYSVIIHHSKLHKILRHHSTNEFDVVLHHSTTDPHHLASLKLQDNQLIIFSHNLLSFFKQYIELSTYTSQQPLICMLHQYWISIYTGCSPRWYNVSNIPFPLNFPVTEDGLVAETGLTLSNFLWNWQIIYLTSHHDEFLLYRQKGNNFLKINLLLWINYAEWIKYDPRPLKKLHN